MEHRSMQQHFKILLLLGSFQWLTGILAGAAPVKGSDVFNEAFSDPAAPGWAQVDSVSRPFVVKDGKLTLEVLPETPQLTHKLAHPLPPDRFRNGAMVYLSATVQAENVSQRAKPWNGVKFGAEVQRADGSKEFPQAKVRDGSFGPERIGVLLTIPADATQVRLIIGLENVSGKASFSDIRASLVDAQAEASAQTSTTKGPGSPLSFKTKLRGVMVKPDLSPEALRFLGKQWGVNLIRWQVAEPGTYPKGLETPELEAAIDHELAKLDALLPICRELGISVALDLHSLSIGLFSNVENQERIVAVWKKMASRYKDEPAVWAYDIANEPKQDDWHEGAQLWNELATRIAQAIRNVDPKKPIIVECVLLGQPEGMAYLRPVPVSNVIYSAHMYHPLKYTHNKVNHADDKALVYPGEINGITWDKAQIERELAPVIEFQQKYNVPIYIGEFSAIRWAPGAAQYLADCIEVFEKYGWDWSYHAFREWQGWSAEHGSDFNDPAPAPQPTDREKVLRSWFSKNSKPQWLKK